MDIDYPPSRSTTLESAHASVCERIEELDAEIDRLEDSDDASESRLQDCRAERTQRADERDALQWAINEFGGECEVTLQALTTNRRSRVLDTANQRTMGELGGSQLQDWLLAGGITEAPWLDGGEDLHDQYQILGALPPALTDWLNRQANDLNDLTEGN